MIQTRDHGGGLDAAAARYGGQRSDWIDLSTGINPVPYPVGELPDDAWTALPDQDAQNRLVDAARQFWQIPNEAALLAAPGASILISHIPYLRDPGQVDIPQPTYNEHWAAFKAAGWVQGSESPDARVVVHPNNPTGDWYDAARLTDAFTVIDESFCDVDPRQSLIEHTSHPNRIVLKSFGKFWGLAGLRLGFAIGQPKDIEQLQQRLGPWPVSGPALAIAAQALTDDAWAQATRIRLQDDADRLDALMAGSGATLHGGTILFRLYHVPDAVAVQNRLAHHKVWSRIFPYSRHFLRLGLPAPHQWTQLENALK